MERRRFERGEVARMGQDIYEREIREKVQPGGEHDGEFLVIDVTTGNGRWTPATSPPPIAR